MAQGVPGTPARAGLEGLCWLRVVLLTGPPSPEGGARREASGSYTSLGKHTRGVCGSSQGPCRTHDTTHLTGQLSAFPPRPLRAEIFSPVPVCTSGPPPQGPVTCPGRGSSTPVSLEPWCFVAPVLQPCDHLHGEAPQSVLVFSTLKSIFTDTPHGSQGGVSPAPSLGLVLEVGSVGWEGRMVPGTRGAGRSGCSRECRFLFHWDC